MTLTIGRTGPLTSVQDLGRPGLAHLGVGTSGAADRPAHRLANRLVGNPEGAATLETTLGGLVVTTDGPAWVALAGAPAPMTVDGAPVAAGAPVHLGAGARLEIGVPPTGLRSYLAVRGGIAVDPVLGSRSTDVLSGIGPPRPAEGDTLPVDRPARRWRAPVDHAPLPPIAAEPTLELRAGPRERWFTSGALAALTETIWEVTPDADRVGVRLAGRALERARTDELPSEGMVLGALQVPPDGRPILFLADHPVTGGYPVIGVLTDAAVAAAAQLRPGARCRLRVRQSTTRSV